MEVLILPEEPPPLTAVVDDAIVQDQKLKKLVDDANRILAREIGESADSVRVRWELRGTAPEKLLELTLTDPESHASVFEWFTPSLLKPGEDLDARFYSLWADFLQAKNRSLMKKIMAGS